MWADIKGWEGLYKVSKLGEVWSLKAGKLLTPMRTGTKRQGSQRSKVRLRTNPRIDVEIGSLVLTTFVCPRPAGGVVMHKNDDASDNRILNLCWGSPTKNARDMAAKCRGGSQKLTSSDVKEIARRRKQGERGSQLAKEFGVSPQRVCDIFKERTTLLEEFDGE